jgi:hypothetical protein
VPREKLKHIEEEEEIYRNLHSAVDGTNEPFRVRTENLLPLVPHVSL